MKGPATQRRLPVKAVWPCLIALLLWLASATAQALEPAPAPSSDATHGPAHGLLGHYYTRDLPGSFDLKGFLVDEYGIPVPNKPPNAIRRDAQIAFGKGQGFARAANGSQLVWWAPAEARAVVWKGYIRLPVAGTYHLTTASSGASAVYLGSARVSLNGGFGGSVPSEQFSLGETGTGAAYSAIHGQYVVPIPVSGPRVLPIEVRYLLQDSSGVPRGIDLYWVRPDAPRDAAGKAVAQIVPSEALFVEPPEPLSASLVSGPHSTMSSDVLYLPDGGEDVATLTIRVADKTGQPVAGKQVFVSSLHFASGGAGSLVQPQAPTDAQGIATAQFRMTTAHNRRFFATVLDDAVDVGQEVEILGQRGQLAFLPLTYSPYYGGKHFLVTPLPLTVGQLATISVPLMNRLKEPYELSVRVLATIPNIGAYNFGEIGRTETFVLRPGESREVKVGWTPKEAGGKICFNIQVWGRPAPSQTSGVRPLELLSVAFAQPSPAPRPTSEPVLMDSRTHNIGPVELPPCDEPQTPRRFEAGPYPHPNACVPTESEKSFCTAAIETFREWRQQAKEALSQAQLDRAISIARGNKADEERFQRLIQRIQESFARVEDLMVMYDQCVADPPDPRYKQLAAAPSDTPAGYLAALVMSMERYQGAEAAGDREWMARHLTARRLYLQRHAAALRRAGDAMRKMGEELASTDTAPAESLRTILLEAATLYRVSADEADRVARPSGSTGVAGKASAPIAETYVVVNPHEREETIDLFIRRGSVSPEWTLSVVDAETGPDGKPRGRVQEVEAGRHYRVHLPAKGQLTVASVVVPVGVVGENTVANWAVEGKIGDELLGGMVHELYVPGSLPDLQLPPIAGSADGWPGFGSPFVWLAGATAVLLVGIAFLVWRRKRSRA